MGTNELIKTRRNPPVVVVQIHKLKGTVSRHDFSYFRVLKSINYHLTPDYDIVFSSFVFHPKFWRDDSGEQTVSVVETVDKEFTGVNI
jgi:hypothetical protein